MNFKKGNFRIYIVLSVLWFCFFLYGSQTGHGYDLIYTALIPIPLYFVLRWILKGFE